MAAVAAVNPQRGYPWWLLLLEGIASLILGILLFSSPVVTTIVLIRVLGWYWLITGMLTIVTIFTGDTDIHWAWLLIQGIVGIIAGFFILDHPLVSTLLIPTTLVIIMGVQGLIIGLISIVAAFQGGGWGTAILGILSVVFGLILLGSPLIAASVLPFIISGFAVVGGIAAIIAAFQVRSSE